jgi:hypothetical protein
MASIWFRQSGAISSRPPAGNAHRWALTFFERENHVSNFRLYKNLPGVYLSAFKEKGSIRVGTLSAYRAIEGPRQDVKEGRKDVEFRPKEGIFFPEVPTDLMPPNVRITGGYLYLGPESTADFGSQVPNAYVFCVSEAAIPGKFGDAHYEIINPILFGNMLLKKLKETDPLIYSAHLDKVVYGGPKDVQITRKDELKRLKGYNMPETVLSDYYRKPSKFSHEREHRYVFLTTKPRPNEFVDLYCDLKIIKACCRFS